MVLPHGGRVCRRLLQRPLQILLGSFFILPLHYQIYSKSTFDAFGVVFIFHLSQTEMILSQKSTVHGLFFHQQFQTFET